MSQVHAVRLTVDLAAQVLFQQFRLNCHETGSRPHYPHKGSAYRICNPLSWRVPYHRRPNLSNEVPNREAELVESKVATLTTTALLVSDTPAPSLCGIGGPALLTALGGYRLPRYSAIIISKLARGHLIPHSSV